MNTTIVISNPSIGSFSMDIMDSIIKELKEKNSSHEIIDLYEEKFDPVMTEAQEKLYSQGESDDKLVKKYQGILKNTDEIIFICPLWFNNVPAMMKGFFDKVLIKEFAFTEENERPKGLLKNIKSGLVVTTSESSTEHIINDFGNPIENAVIKGALNVCGMENIKWLNYNVAVNSEENKKEFLNTVNNYLK